MLANSEAKSCVASCAEEDVSFCRSVIVPGKARSRHSCVHLLFQENKKFTATRTSDDSRHIESQRRPSHQDRAQCCARNT